MIVGQTLGQYRIVKHLGEGAMGDVYHAVDELLDRDVALKMLRPALAHRHDLVARFRVEATTLAKLDHPNITHLLGLVKHEADLFMVMEYVNGETLSDIVQRGGPLRWREAVAWVGEVLAALEYAHGVGVVHRDIKPANVLIRRDGRVKVTDFGIARVLGSARSTREGHIIGTLEYIAPEQIRGEDATASADLYSTGVLLYEALTGRTPYSGSTDYDLMQQHINAPVPTVQPMSSDLPAWFDGVIARAMAKTPAERFASAGDFRRELVRLADAEPAAAIKGTVLGPGFTPVVVPPATRLGPGSAENVLPPKRLAPPAASAVRRVTWQQWTSATCAVIVFFGIAYGGTLLMRSRRTDQPAPAASPVAVQPVLEQQPQPVSAPPPAPPHSALPHGTSHPRT